MDVSVVMPCLNEAETLALCIKKAQQFINRLDLNGEVVVADNGSSDGSQQIAESNGARVIPVALKGYGSAIKGGVMAAKSEFVIIGDSDDSHDLENLDLFYKGLLDGKDLVIGNRFKGGLSKKDMPFLHRYLGNPVLTGLGNLFFKTKIGDFHCGLRGVRKTAFAQMNLVTNGMEFASEMIVKAKLNDLEMLEVPTKVFPSGRSRPAHLQTWPDGWRHLRFLLLYSPKWLFFNPGFLLVCLGGGMLLYNLFSTSSQNFAWLGAATVFLLVGYQFMLFYALTKIYATNHGLIPASKNYQKIFARFTLERGLVLGVLLMLMGLISGVFTISLTQQAGVVINKWFFAGLIGICVGVQTVLFSFFFSILGLKGSPEN